ncbi:hypothetical protein JX265_013884 [Neoarthrinium moseri]|uniref:Uncharacterized protein n=1 Tax=Neoarthrinium moseri TaxID=1658444 RepID=A0A9P9W7P1_9PEZI|nr:hypothetical protein JX265_013884 [Neoarthrinium moseri]
MAFNRRGSNALRSHESARASFVYDENIDQHVDSLQGQPANPPQYGRSPAVSRASSLRVSTSAGMTSTPPSPLPSANRQSFFPSTPPPFLPGMSSQESIDRRSSSSSTAGVPPAVRRPLGLLRRVTSGTRTLYERRKEKEADARRVPPCPRHETPRCAQDLHWVAGADFAVPQPQREDGLAVQALAYDKLRFDPDSDSLIGAAEERGFRYREPRNHWFHYCNTCKLAFLKGSAGKAVATHPGHLAEADAGQGFGTRAVAVYVDATPGYGDGPKWSIYFGPKSPYNEQSSPAGILPVQVELRAIWTCLTQVQNRVVTAQQERVRAKLKTNSADFALAAQRFSLLVFTPLKSALALCADEADRVLEHVQQDSETPGPAEAAFAYPEQTPDWVAARRASAEWREEKARVELAVVQLAAVGVQVRFYYTPVEGEYAPEWKALASAGSFA